MKEKLVKIRDKVAGGVAITLCAIAILIVVAFWAAAIGLALFER